jgi:uncharacterized protein
MRPLRRWRTGLLGEPFDYAELLNEMATSLCTVARVVVGHLEEPPTHEAQLEPVRQLEHRGDELLRQVTGRVAVSSVGPFHREDLHALAEGLDNVIDDLHHVAELLVALQPPSIPHELLDLAHITSQAAEQVVELMALPTKRVPRPELEAIDQLKEQGDATFRQALTWLFQAGHDELDVLRWKYLLEGLEHALNGIEHVGDLVEGTVLRHG